MSQKYVLPIIIGAFFVTEYAQVLASKFGPKLFIVLAILVGIYGGLFGAGIFLLILALVRMKIPQDERIIEVRVNTVVLEIGNAAAAVVAFAILGKLSFTIWVPWAAGSIIGGYLGGVVIKKTGHCAPETQKTLLRLIFLFALLISVYKLF